MSFININPLEIDNKDMHQFLIGAISPRPIALVSTLDENGVPNLAPYSFFNALSSKPAMLAFSSNLKTGENKEKDTLRNIKQTKNCVINIVNYEIVRQMTLCSIAYKHGISEFNKSGLTMLKSDLVESFRVKESPVQFECTVHDIIALGNEAGASNLIVCNILKMHVLKSILTDNLRRIDPNKLDAMGRLGRSNYVRVKGDNILEMYQSTIPNCIGFDGLPKSIQKSMFLSGHQIAELASVDTLPTKETVDEIYQGLKASDKNLERCHLKAIDALNANAKVDALKFALIPEYFL
jgi:flavin reductase (DIM6/NTAB) family NADH-FMN oxidoreductase RutF